MEAGSRNIWHRSRSGFTLLEVMVAFTILTVGLLAIIPVTLFMVRSNLHNRYFTKARMLAEQFSERLRTVDYEDALISDDGDTTDANNITNPDHADTVAVDNMDYYIMWNVKDRANPPGLKEINIIVLWYDPVMKRRGRVSTLAYKAAVSR
ncbi:prepilin-type N-terminal cleavage/methylation domain-containing protein [bacterium]|nr:prepilin-type N-terminal cleavage/methylation domain-containing protein [bacterium]